jgi:hypothetical protein
MQNCHVGHDNSQLHGLAKVLLSNDDWELVPRCNAGAGLCSPCQRSNSCTSLSVCHCARRGDEVTRQSELCILQLVRTGSQTPTIGDDARVDSPALPMQMILLFEALYKPLRTYCIQIKEKTMSGACMHGTSLARTSTYVCGSNRLASFQANTSTNFIVNECLQ